MRKGSFEDHLQPALLDRLMDDEPGRKIEGREHRAISEQKLRAGVLRDLAWLFNAVRPTDRVDWELAPHAQASVINFGLPAFSGRGLSTLDVADLESQIRQAIITFEPRIDSTSVRVHAIDSDDAQGAHNQIRLEIHGTLWGQPLPLEILLRTDVDLETGQVEIKDIA